MILVLVLLLVLVLSQIVSGSDQYGWTYRTTASNCQGYYYYYYYYYCCCYYYYYYCYCTGSASSPCGPDYWYKVIYCDNYHHDHHYHNHYR